MNFITFKNAVAKQFEAMARHQLFVTEVTKDKLVETYLGSFPEGSNPIYKTNTEHDCTCCKQFIRAVGNVVAVIDGKLVSIWDVSVGGEYQVVTNAMSALVKSAPIDNIFLHYEKQAGTDKNLQDTLDGIKTWNHFFVNIPPKFYMREPGPALGQARATHDVLLRSLNEITDDAIYTVLELISQNSLYRGEEHRYAVEQFRKVKRDADGIDNLDQYVWSKVNDLSPSISRIRNTAIGTLLVDLSDGDELDKAVASFEAKVAPTNYKRPTALVTKSMIDAAKKTIEELGLTSALQRRYANLEDITINNLLYADRSVRSALEGDVFDQLTTKVGNPKSMDKVEEVGIDDFLANILPMATSLEVMMENHHTGNLMSLIAPVDPTALPMFKWDNKFSWSYQGDVADSIKERVKQAGGNVTGELCCRLAWDYADDLDFYMQEPNGNTIYYGVRRQLSKNGGMLDVDANGIDGVRENPVENIFYEKISTMTPGMYHLYVQNFSRRSDGTGFEVEVDLKGNIHTFTYDKKVATSGKVQVAEIHIKADGSIDIVGHLPSSQSVKQVWGVNTNTFQKVGALMLSPNHWDGHGVGNKHFFFMLDGCKNEGVARGFYNEFLNADLDKHRKVLEMVGAKLKTERADQQLSGLGFSSTQRNSILCRVTGSFTRTIKINF